MIHKVGQGALLVFLEIIFIFLAGSLVFFFGFWFSFPGYRFVVLFCCLIYFLFFVLSVDVSSISFLVFDLFILFPHTPCSFIFALCFFLVRYSKEKEKTYNCLLVPTMNRLKAS